MKEALMKLEPEVTADPKGTAVNSSLVQPSLGRKSSGMDNFSKKIDAHWMDLK